MTGTKLRTFAPQINVSLGETKSTTQLDDLRPDERRKILCGKSHFQEALGVDYRVVTAGSQLV
jgi:restriction endonuclease